MAWARCYVCNPEHDLLLTASQAAPAAAAELQSLGAAATARAGAWAGASVEAGFDLFLVVQFMSEGEAATASEAAAAARTRDAPLALAIHWAEVQWVMRSYIHTNISILYMPYICVLNIYVASGWQSVSTRVLKIRKFPKDFKCLSGRSRMAKGKREGRKHEVVRHVYRSQWAIISCILLCPFWGYYDGCWCCLLYESSCSGFPFAIFGHLALVLATPLERLLTAFISISIGS